MKNPFQHAERKQAFWDDSAQNKTTLRPVLIAERAQLAPKAVAYKNAIINQILAHLPEIISAQTIACYNGFRNEVDVSHFIGNCLAQNKRVVLPKIKQKAIDFYHVSDVNVYQQTGAFGILEPDDAQCPLIQPQEIDLFIVPAVAFDVFGYRIGYGGGYYDRFLQQKREDAVTIGVGYDMQLLHAIKTEPHDIPLDRVVTDKMHHTNIITPTWSEHRTHSPAETQSFAQNLAAKGLLNEPVIALHGNLGTGKTEFVKGLANACNAKQTVSSPTYVFIHEYEGEPFLRHIDCYRIDELQKEDHEFWHEALTNPDGCIVIEWAERIGDLLPSNTVHLYGEQTGEESRTWTLFTAFRGQNHLHEVGRC